MLVYVDESGHPHPHDAATRPVLAAVCIREEDSRDISRQLFNLKNRLLGRADFELKALRFLNRRTFRRVPAKWELVESTFELIRNLPVIIFAIIMERPQNNPSLPRDFLPFQHRFLLQRANALMDEGSGMALMIFDGQGMSFDGGLSASFSGFLFRSRAGQSFQRIVETPLFVDSRITPGLQLADMVASCVRQHEENNLQRGVPRGDAYLSAIARYYRIIESKTRDLEGYPGYPLLRGLHFMPERYFYEVAEDEQDDEA